jgi:hypothetical protein
MHGHRRSESSIKFSDSTRTFFLVVELVVC